jgi:putative DNA primase/helicase
MALGCTFTVIQVPARRQHLLRLSRYGVARCFVASGEQRLTDWRAPDGQERRAARALAIAALAGELAIEFGITHCQAGDPTEVAVQAFKSWQGQLGTRGCSVEHVGILQAVSEFIDRCGEARFSDMAVSN